MVGPTVIKLHGKKKRGINNVAMVVIVIGCRNLLYYIRSKKGTTMVIKSEEIKAALCCIGALSLGVIVSGLMM